MTQEQRERKKVVDERLSAIRRVVFGAEGSCLSELYGHSSEVSIHVPIVLLFPK